MTLQTLYPGIANSPVTVLTSGISTSATSIPVQALECFPAAPNIAVVGGCYGDPGNGEYAVTYAYTGKDASSGPGNLTGCTVVEGTDRVWASGVSVSRPFTNKDWSDLVTNSTQWATATSLVGLLEYQGVLDCSTNPNYPEADKGDCYFVSVAGKVGGASGTAVEVGDMAIAKADNAGGTQASVGGSWNVIQSNLVGAVVTASTLEQGDILYYTGSAWVALPHGTDGQYLKTQGHGANPTWADVTASSSVATDTIWDAAGDLAVGTGSNTAGRLAIGTAGQLLKVNSGATGLEWATVAGTGDVVGPASSTDNTIARFNGTDNKTIQGSLVTIDDNGSVNVPSGQAYKINGTALAASDVGAATTSTKLDDFAAPDDNTDLNASTSAHGLLVKATAPAAGLRNVVGIDNGETAYTNKALFDATDPAMNGTAAPGSAMTAARRDHVHASDTSRAPANPLATDSLWDAAGDLVVGSGANTAAKLSKGTANQVLHVKSDGSTLEWTDPSAGTTVATDAIWDAAGDLVVGSGANTAAKLAIGTAGQVLKVNSGATGLEWGAAAGDVATDAIWDAAGDLAVGSGANTAARLAKGTAYQVLRMKSDASTVEWGAPVYRLSAVTGSITINTTANDDGSALNAISVGANIGTIVRIRLWADQNMGQRTAGTFLINNGSGIATDGTELAYDGLVGTLPTAGAEGTGDYIWIDNELCRVASGTSTPLTIVRGLCGTTAAYHDDNAVCRTANEGFRISLYRYNVAADVNRIFDWRKIYTGTWTTDAAITLGDDFCTLSSSPTILPDFGVGDNILLSDTSSEIMPVQALYGSVAGTTYDDSIFIRDPAGSGWAAHDTAKTVYRLCEWNTPIPFSLNATTLYMTIYPNQLLPGNITIYYELLIDKMG